ncbi:MAG: N-acetyl-gamma-glutamyl-phosphate reductase [Peptococcaceae bacterium]|jgi:N-acetyl-gamma-glutamyl-phosphate reductase|nr:N-acetyl-gamma-glutamyl-phosphate reductase [Peptococcaceae bacterium]
MKSKVFVDGQEGTTGLKINERLANREDLEILRIAPEKRKDASARRALLNEADVVFLCLPDEAAREAVSLVTNEKTRVIDASTAHRTHPDWVYGLPELSGEQREKIQASRRVCVPGCHATGFTTILYPLVQEGIVARDYPVTSYSVSGYSGGGKKLIAAYEEKEGRDERLKSPRLYALDLRHKHLPEMQKINGLTHLPLFTPMVGDYYQGMVVGVPLTRRLLAKRLTAREVWEAMTAYYHGQRFIRVMPFASQEYLDRGYLDATGCNHTNRVEIFVCGEGEQILLLARLDNLGKGASGAAVQNLNRMLGMDEGTGLV